MTTHPALNLITEKEQPKHVEEYVRDAPVGEHVGKELPEPVVANYVCRAQDHVCERSGGNVVYKKNEYIETDNDKRCVVEFVLKWSSYK